jgi:hypothetical protein
LKSDLFSRNKLIYKLPKLIRMSPSAISEDEIIEPLPVQALQTKKQYASGDPILAYVDEEAENPPTFTDPYEERTYLKHRLVLAFRVFAQHGLSEGVAGHITLRDPVDPTSFWVNPFGTHFSLLRDEDLIRVDHYGKVVEGGKNKRLNYGVLFNIPLERGKYAD